MWYKSLKKSKLSPPSWVFPIVWPILYVLIIISGFVYLQNGGTALSRGFLYYIIAWILNLSWSPIFFSLHRPDISFIVVLLMLFFIYMNILEFYKISKNAGYILIPYILWVMLASYLNGYIYIMNRK